MYHIYLIIEDIHLGRELNPCFLNPLRRGFNNWFHDITSEPSAPTLTTVHDVIIYNKNNNNNNNNKNINNVIYFRYM